MRQNSRPGMRLWPSINERKTKSIDPLELECGGCIMVVQIEGVIGKWRRLPECFLTDQFQGYR